MKNKKNVIYALILPLVVVSGLVFANRGIKNETKRPPKSLSMANGKACLDERNNKVLFNRDFSKNDGC
ncbi:hypothetical protein [Pedobacter frigoris]|uniref:hypothetical protein n=1 Tax=Pedobacter frigoris TaxID=2571272 RepID=UPI00292E0228|nr:hypothetical protein [Pedobacter frigoris]